MTIKKYRADKNMKIENVISDQMPYSKSSTEKGNWSKLFELPPSSKRSVTSLLR